MRNERILWLLAMVGLLAFHSFGQSRPLLPDPPTLPNKPVVVSITSHVTKKLRGGEGIRLYRVWSNGLTEQRSWNSRPDPSVTSLKWTEWQAF